MDPDKLALAKQLYVKDGKSLTEICLLLDISMFVLKERCEAESWAKTRKAHTEKRSQHTSLQEHAEISEQQVRNLRVLMIQNGDPDLTLEEKRDLTYKISRALELAEAWRVTVETDRLIHGIVKGKPSVAADDDEVDGVTYVVAKPPSSVYIEEDSHVA